jgi:hypothetical protein
MRLPIIGEIGVLDVLLFPIVYLLAVLAPLALAPPRAITTICTRVTREIKPYHDSNDQHKIK